jgi:phosphatidylethanolamine/phosphatidyl-N-methylethanolamine N-methyltransferase
MPRVTRRMDEADETPVTDFYAKGYDAVICEGGTGWAVAVAHRVIERGAVDDYPRVLEVGAGAGVHRQYVTHPYREYVETDLRNDETPEVTALDHGRTLRREYADAAALPYESHSFDRVIATCLLIHLAEPERALEEWRRVVRPGGLLTVYVPCDPGILLRSIRSVTTARKARRLGFGDYALWHAREHCGHAAGLDVRVRHVVRNDVLTTKRWPLPLATWNLNLFSVYQVTIRDVASGA